MILSDRSIREELAAGRIQIDPFDETIVSFDTGAGAPRSSLHAQRWAS